MSGNESLSCPRHILYEHACQECFARKRDEQAPYASLRSVLDAAYNQASAGKGKERHAGKNEYFENQQIVQLCEWMGSNHGDIFQACKKALESVRLPDDRAVAELLGAINYLAAAVLVIQRRSK